MYIQSNLNIHLATSASTPCPRSLHVQHHEARSTVPSLSTAPQPPCSPPPFQAYRDSDGRLRSPGPQQYPVPRGHVHTMVTYQRNLCKLTRQSRSPSIQPYTESTYIDRKGQIGRTFLLAVVSLIMSMLARNARFGTRHGACRRSYILSKQRKRTEKN